jgi:hypothetical protein
VIVEDIDFAGCFCYPPCSAHDRYVELYRETVRRRGGNADLGPALPACLRRATLEDVGVAVSQACALPGDAKLIPPLTLERIADAVVGEGVATAGGWRRPSPSFTGAPPTRLPSWACRRWCRHGGRPAPRICVNAPHQSRWSDGAAVSTSDQ